MKSCARVFFFCVFTTLAAWGAERPLVAILGAYPPELVALRRDFRVDAKDSGFVTTTLKGVRFDRGVVGGREVVIFQAGPSVVNAAYQLQMALDHFPITHVLFAGVAGGIDPSLDVGDVVIPEKWAYHSEAAYLNEDGKGGYVRPDYLRPAGLENFGMMFPDGVRAIRDGLEKAENIMAFPIDAEMLAVARKAIAKLPAIKKVGAHGGGVGRRDGRERPGVFGQRQISRVGLPRVAGALSRHGVDGVCARVLGESETAAGDPRLERSRRRAAREKSHRRQRAHGFGHRDEGVARGARRDAEVTARAR
jgi:nucleoside phosphorylase